MLNLHEVEAQLKATALSPNSKLQSLSSSSTAQSSSSSQLPAPQQAVSSQAHDLLASHLYHVGFVQGWFSDLHVCVQSPYFIKSSSSSTAASNHIHNTAGTTTTTTNNNANGTISGGMSGAAASNNNNNIGSSSSNSPNSKVINNNNNLQDSSSSNDGVVLYKLHKIVAIRCPMLASLISDAEMRDDSHPTKLSIAVSDPYLTPEGLSIACGHLYANYTQSLLANAYIPTADTPAEELAGLPQRRSALLRGVLSAAALLQLPELALMATDLLRQDMSRATVADHCRFVVAASLLVSAHQHQHHPHASTPAPPSPVSSGDSGVHGSDANVSSTAATVASSVTGSSAHVAGTSPSAGGSATSILANAISEIREAVYLFLCKGLVKELSSDGLRPVWGPSARDGEGYRELVAAFADLPFEWLKRVAESREFDVPSDMERFSFAKDVVGLRMKRRSQNHPTMMMAGEENVLLAFGGGKHGGSGVTIVRKAPRASQAVSAPPHMNGGGYAAPGTVASVHAYGQQHQHQQQYQQQQQHHLLGTPQQTLRTPIGGGQQQHHQHQHHQHHQHQQQQQQHHYGHHAPSSFGAPGQAAVNGTWQQAASNGSSSTSNANGAAGNGEYVGMLGGFGGGKTLYVGGGGSGGVVGSGSTSQERKVWKASA